RRLWLSGLASLQMAIAIVLLVGGGLMLQSFWKLRYQDLGFPSHRIVTATVNLSRARYPSAARQIIFLDAVLDRLRSIPGVQGAGGPVLASCRRAKGMPRMVSRSRDVNYRRRDGVPSHGNIQSAGTSSRCWECVS